jgi:hypothetical protein
MQATIADAGLACYPAAPPLEKRKRHHDGQQAFDLRATDHIRLALLRCAHGQIHSFRGHGHVVVQYQCEASRTLRLRQGHELLDRLVVPDNVPELLERVREGFLNPLPERFHGSLHSSASSTQEKLR